MNKAAMDRQVMMRVTAVLGMMLAVPASHADGPHSRRVSELYRQLNTLPADILNDGSRMQDTKQALPELTEKAKSLDATSDEINSLNAEVPGLEARYNNAQARADALEAQLQVTTQDAQNRLSALQTRYTALCSRYGGVVQGKECIFTCPQSNMGPCETRRAQFAQEQTVIEGQAKKIADDYQQEIDKAHAADNEAAKAKAEYAEKQARLKEDQAALERDEPGFETECNAAAADIRAFSHLPKNDEPAFRQANDIANHTPGSGRGSGFDTTIPAAALPKQMTPTPNASAAYTSAAQRASTNLSNAVDAENRAMAQYLDVVQHHGEPQQVQQALKTLTEKQGARIYAAYEAKMIGNLTQLPPKPAQ